MPIGCNGFKKLLELIHKLFTTIFVIFAGFCRPFRPPAGPSEGLPSPAVCKKDNNVQNWNTRETSLPRAN
jgi:hypothetical protein